MIELIEQMRARVGYGILVNRYLDVTLKVDTVAKELLNRVHQNSGAYKMLVDLIEVNERTFRACDSHLSTIEAALEDITNNRIIKERCLLEIENLLKDVRAIMGDK